MTHDEEIRAMNRQIQSALTLTPPPPSLSHGDSLLDLPSHLVEEILFRVPVKSLFQLQCLCKRLNALISDLKFRINHLRFCFSNDRFQVHTISPYECRITSYPIDSILSPIDTSSTVKCRPYNLGKITFPSIVGSCDGILCIAIPFITSTCPSTRREVIVLCNPTIKKFNQLPRSFEEKNNKYEEPSQKAYGFGYDPLSNKYKVVVIFKGKTQVKIHTLGTYIWRNIGDFPFGFPDQVGVFLNGTVNWLASKDKDRRSRIAAYNDRHRDRTKPDIPCVIVSLNLGNESFEQVPQPNYGRRIPPYLLFLSVHRDCLWLLADHDVWMMKEFGNQDSWTKLITIPNMLKDPTASSYDFQELLYVSADDKMVLVANEIEKLVVCDSRNGLVKYNNSTCDKRRLHLSIESLISP